MITDSFFFLFVCLPPLLQFDTLIEPKKKKGKGVSGEDRQKSAFHVSQYYGTGVYSRASAFVSFLQHAVQMIVY